MNRLLSPAAAAAALILAACAHHTSVAAGTGLIPVRNGQTELSPAARGPRPYTDADVQFMSGMIHHHAQAVIMAGWAKSHGANPALQRLCERIVNAQSDEIVVMQGWLRDRGKPVPNATDTKMHMTMNGMTHDMLMPGMLSDEEMASLDKARGVEFDRQFLVGMIKHHEGAITMVNEVLAAPGAVQDDLVFKFTNDIYADQTTEIAVMQKMLETLPPK
ncbi:MAG TPA: DUF305 domain-containing protein [Gemmatimonadaceae bacterium]|nr:DUF305 domain-containing protein [Gemmatimonadaceae bacterium]